jgi:hypothetical protein
MEEAGTDPRLEALQRHGQRRLGEVCVPGRLGQRPSLDREDEVLQLFQHEKYLS